MVPKSVQVRQPQLVRRLVREFVLSPTPPRSSVGFQATRVAPRCPSPVLLRFARVAPRSASPARFRPLRLRCGSTMHEPGDRGQGVTRNPQASPLPGREIPRWEGFSPEMSTRLPTGSTIRTRRIAATAVVAGYRAIGRFRGTDLVTMKHLGTASQSVVAVGGRFADGDVFHELRR